MTSVVDSLSGRQSQWKTTSVEEDLRGRQPHLKTTSVEDNLSGRQPQMISLEEDHISLKSALFAMYFPLNKVVLAMCSLSRM